MKDNPRAKRHESRGNWWPYREGPDRRRIWQRYGVLETSGYYGDGWKSGTSYHVVDLAICAEVVKTFSAVGKPGSARAYVSREAACVYADELNELERQQAAA